MTTMTKADWLAAAAMFDRKATEARLAGFAETAARLAVQAERCRQQAAGVAR